MLSWIRFFGLCWGGGGGGRGGLGAGKENGWGLFEVSICFGKTYPISFIVYLYEYDRYFLVCPKFSY